ncbi:hypothetical protein [Streptomyces sp. NPDC049744]|uniref:hypothetical protein n=1 Tax=Streptomyces sp. NPDC049744 TaxID=3154359 RepID=UPI003443775D
MTDQTTPRDRLFALIASIPGSASVDWCDDARALVDEIATPSAPLPADEARTRLLQALDASYCQALGHTPEGLLAAYEASRTQTVDPAALRDPITQALAVAEGWQFADGSDLYDLPERERMRYRDSTDAVLAVLPATTNHDTDTSASHRCADCGGEFTPGSDMELTHNCDDHREAEPASEIRTAALHEAASAACSGAVEFNTEAVQAALKNGGAFALIAYVQLAIADHLRRVADETAATATARGCPPDCPCRAVCIGTPKPAAGARQDGAQP